MKKDNKYSGETVNCAVCGASEVLHWNLTCNEELFTHQMCFSCNHWRGHFEQNFDRSLRIKGVHYLACDESGPDRWRGFGGVKFKIKKFDGTVIETSNLWCQGHISQAWKGKLPDNAETIGDETLA